MSGGTRPIGVVQWAKRLVWETAHERSIPEETFDSAADLGLLLARLWEGDGSLSLAGHASYDTASRRLAQEIQHLLLRIGIVSRLYKRARPYRDGIAIGFVVTITGQRNLRRFHRVIARRFLNASKRQLMEQILQRRRDGRASRDVIPVAVRAMVDSARRSRRLTWARLGDETGLSMRAICSPDGSKRGYRRRTIVRLARYFECPDLRRLAESDLYWDRIVSVEPMGERETYDLHVEEDHNFIANDLIVHNSHAASFALLAYASAYLKTHYPAAFYAALLNNQPMGFYTRRRSCATPGAAARCPSRRRVLSAGSAPSRPDEAARLGFAT